MELYREWNFDSVVGKLYKGFKVTLTLDKEFPGCLLAQRRLQGLDQAAGRGFHGLTLTLAYFPSSGLLSTQCKTLEHPYFLCMDRSIDKHSICSKAHAEKTPIGNHWCDGTYI